MQKKKFDPSKLRVRYDPPTLDEAVFAAQGLTSDIEGQVDIASSLIGLPEAEVREAVRRARMVSQRQTVRIAGRRQAVVVERRAPRLMRER